MAVVRTTTYRGRDYMNDFGASESTNMIEHDRLGGEQLNPFGEGINDNKYILVTMGIFGQWSNMIQMKNFKWIVGRTCAFVNVPTVRLLIDCNYLSRLIDLLLQVNR